jgi:hypothetical protein
MVLFCIIGFSIVKCVDFPFNCHLNPNIALAWLQIALGNILKFRKKNWQFDVIGGIIYFVLVFSAFPQCDLDHILQDDTWLGHL